MRKLFLASHGSLAEGMHSAATMILGEKTNIQSYGLDHWETPKNILKEIRREVEASPDDDCLVLCDIKSGSVHNRLLELCCTSNVTLITGMNLALVLELALPQEDTLSAEIESAMTLAKKNIMLFNIETLNKLKAQQKEEELW